MFKLSDIHLSIWVLNFSICLSILDIVALKYGLDDFSRPQPQNSRSFELTLHEISSIGKVLRMVFIDYCSYPLNDIIFKEPIEEISVWKQKVAVAHLFSMVKDAIKMISVFKDSSIFVVIQKLFDIFFEDIKRLDILLVFMSRKSKRFQIKSFEKFDPPS